MRTILVACIILVAHGGFCSELPDDALTHAIRYGMAWESYWDAAYNDLSPKAASMLAAQGKVMRVEVWKTTTDAREADSVYYIEPDSHGRDTMPVPQFMIYARRSSVTAIDFGFRGTNGFKDRDTLKVSLPENFRKIASQFSPGAARMLVPIQTGLKGLLVSRHIKGPQHFFVGPFTEYSPKLIIFWVEQKNFIETGPPISTNAASMTRQLTEATYTTVDFAGGGEEHVGLQAKVEEISWADKWVANCVLDGKLVEVEAP